MDDTTRPPAPPALLLVEDHPLTRDLLAEWLRRLIPGLRLRSVGDAEAALLLLREDACDLVIMDLCLPGMDGIAAARLIAQIRPALPVVILTQHEAVHYRGAVDRAAVCAYLPKRLLHTALPPLLTQILHGRVERP